MVKFHISLTAVLLYPWRWDVKFTLQSLHTQVKRLLCSLHEITQTSIRRYGSFKCVKLEAANSIICKQTTRLSYRLIKTAIKHQTLSNTILFCYTFTYKWQYCTKYFCPFSSCLITPSMLYQPKLNTAPIRVGLCLRHRSILSSSRETICFTLFIFCAKTTRQYIYKVVAVLN
jgi:hypothetical protein